MSLRLYEIVQVGWLTKPSCIVFSVLVRQAEAQVLHSPTLLGKQFKKAADGLNCDRYSIPAYAEHLLWEFPHYIALQKRYLKAVSPLRAQCYQYWIESAVKKKEAVQALSSSVAFSSLTEESNRYVGIFLP